MTGTSLKFLMMFLMVLDHISPFVSFELAAVFHFITRCVSPVFGFMAMEGFIHTNNIKNYLIRLYSWSIFMFVGNSIMNKYLISDAAYKVTNNIFFTLALGVSMLYVYEKFYKDDKKSLGLILMIIIFGIGFLFSEGGLLLIPFMFISYVYRDKTKKRNIILIVMSFLLSLTSWVDYGNFKESLYMFFYNSDPLILIMGLPFIYI